MENTGPAAFAIIVEVPINSPLPHLKLIECVILLSAFPSFSLLICIVSIRRIINPIPFLANDSLIKSNKKYPAISPINIDGKRLHTSLHDEYFRNIGYTLRSQTISIGTIIPTDALAPNSSAIIKTLTIAKPGKPVLENPKLNAPNKAIIQLVVGISIKEVKSKSSDIRV